jgi:hypothetical protein
MKHLFTFTITLLSYFLSCYAIAQTNISGVVNAYAPVTAINSTKTTLTIGTTSGTGSFATGNKVMVMQMKGATIQDTETSTYGQILNYNNAGNYEWATIASVSGNDITLNTALTQNYTISGLVQLIRVPVYPTGAIVTGALTGLAWNGTVGGVLAIEVNGTLRLNNNISMNGAGFRGGAFSTAGGNCSITTYRTNNTQLGYKGEGIAIEPNGNLNGRGALANGGGGGNGHNAGGGGGSNAGQGGTGGREWAGAPIGGWCGVQDGTCSNTNNTVGGIGGYRVNATSSKRYFLGGGGGGGQQDNNVSSAGGNGGGFIFITAGTIDANGANRIISANGNDAANASWDGAGGGGAGGSILLEVNNFVSNISIQANGGKGGDTSGCHGPGGGGGGGYLQFSANMSAFPNVTTSAVAGADGTQPAGTTCGSPAVNVGANYCAVTSAFSSGLIRMNASPMPITLVNIQAENQHHQNWLWWQTASEINNAYFTIERSQNGQTFLPIGKVDGGGNTTGMADYRFIDENPLLGWNYYRLKQTDFDGTFSYSPVVTARYEPIGNLEVYPNPTETGKLTFNLSIDRQDIKGTWAIYDLQGRQVLQHAFEGNKQEIQVATLPKGMYMLSVHTSWGIWQKKVAIM